MAMIVARTPVREACSLVLLQGTLPFLTETGLLRIKGLTAAGRHDLPLCEIDTLQRTSTPLADLPLRPHAGGPLRILVWFLVLFSQSAMSLSW